MTGNNEVNALVRSYAIVSTVTKKVDIVRAIDSQKAINEAIHAYPQHNTTWEHQELTNYFSYEITQDDIIKLKQLGSDEAKADFLNNQYPKHPAWQV